MQVSKLKPIKEENIIKVNRPRKLIITPRQAEEGKVSDERIAKVSGEFSVNIKHDDIILAQSMFNNKLRGTLEENAKELENINWGGYDVEKIVDALYAISISLSDGMDIPYQRMITKRIFRALLLNESNPITVLLARQAGKCLAKGTLVMMFDRSSKKVEDIQVGDLIMGDDGSQRRILSLASGKEDMYEVVPESGSGAKPYTVNFSHILSLYNIHSGEVVDMDVANCIACGLGRDNASLYGYRVSKDFKDKIPYKISINKVGIGDYYGFTIDGNKRFLLSDFTVTHNTEVSGRTGVTCCGVMPALARIFPEQLSMYDKGFWIGVYAPSGEQADTLYRRMKAMAARESASAVFNDPDIAADLDKRSGARWSNNSFIHAQSASPRSSIEGKTLHLCLIDECQDMDANVLEKSIFPMMAWTNGLPVMTGTVNDKISYYYQQIVRNKDMGLVLPADRQLHFQFDYKEVIKYNPRYAKHIETEKIKNGEDSLFFKMSYGLEWPHMKSNTFTPQDLQRYSLVRERELKTYGTGRFVAGIDLASKRASTVVTVLEIEETQMLFSDGIREAVHSVAICDWLELTGMPYQDQRDSINSFLAGYEGLEAVVVDTTGVGDPVMEQMESEWNLNARLLPFIFSSSTKDKLAKIFDEFFYSNRLIIPSDDHARRTARWQSFYLQFLSLTKVQLNNFSYYAKQVENKKARDDYFDSLCLALYGVKNSLEFGSGVEVLPYQLKALNSNRGAGRGYSNIDDLRKAARSGNHIPLVERNKKYRRIPKILED